MQIRFPNYVNRVCVKSITCFSLRFTTNRVGLERICSEGNHIDFSQKNRKTGGKGESKDFGKVEDW